MLGNDSACWVIISFNLLKVVLLRSVLLSIFFFKFINSENEISSLPLQRYLRICAPSLAHAVCGEGGGGGK
ncbi:MAG: hypothetical protein A3F74_14760 [Betaproteobacteria bacterium RIFCSPLOWO2_12_FULL_62_58]|nr:MAG: hypothetical protein A3I62_01055 [Betaproteobacteria bacterium RIFCSPLOWO2_02_FULL_62_79]OGA55106.1 MAG: hypothetical protein A3F74_14760 [Betaproteobacteria bacterium RIFCSPLOWO2_12_FULL_62_58]